LGEGNRLALIPNVRFPPYPVLPTLLLLIDALLFAAVLAADPWSGFYMLLLIGLSVPIALWLRRGRALAPPAVQ
jgi:hypothetical protein